jgi:hypothetical protein
LIQFDELKINKLLYLNLFYFTETWIPKGLQHLSGHLLGPNSMNDRNKDTPFPTTNFIDSIRHCGFPGAWFKGWLIYLMIAQLVNADGLASDHGSYTRGIIESGMPHRSGQD